MEQNITVRMAVLEDVDALLAIYAPYCTETVITFEYDVPEREEFLNRIKKILSKYPYLVAVENGNIVGYAYASEYKTRAAYQWDVETSIYVDRNCRAHGIGTILYEKLLELLKKQNIFHAYACVTLPNEASQGIHEKFGFRLAGILPKSGYKFGAWHDIGWFEKSLIREKKEPEPVIPIREIAF